MRSIHRFGLAAAIACSVTVAQAKDYEFKIGAVSTADFKNRTYADDQAAGFTAATRIVLDYIRYTNPIALAQGNLNDFIYVIYADGQIGKFKICTGCSSQILPQGTVTTVPLGAVRRSSLLSISEIIYRLDYLISLGEGVIVQSVKEGTVTVVCAGCSVTEYY